MEGSKTLFCSSEFPQAWGSISLEIYRQFGHAPFRQPCPISSSCTSLAIHFPFLSPLLQLILYQTAILAARYVLLSNISPRTRARIDQCLVHVESCVICIMYSGCT